MKNKIIFEGKTKKGKNILIRYPNLKDVLEMNNYINSLSKEKTFVRFQGEQYSLMEEKKYLKEILTRVKNNQEVYLIVLFENKIIGASSIDLSDGAELHVGNLGISVLKNYRNEGIGDMLLYKIIEEAKSNLKNLKIVTLSVFENNKIAQDFYIKFGFKIHGRIPKGIYYQKKYYDNILMNKNI